METEHVVTFLVFYLALAAIIVTFALLVRGRTLGLIVTSIVALVCVGALFAIGSLVSPGRNLVVATFQHVIALQRTHCVAAALGASTALPWLVVVGWYSDNSSRGRRVLTALVLSTALVGATASGSLISAKELLSDSLVNPDPSGKGGLGEARVQADGFQVEKLLDTGWALPIRLAVDSQDRVFFSAQTGLAGWSGTIYELVPISRDGDRNSGPMQSRKVADSLNNPYGLATRDGDLYVARATQYTRAVNGKLIHENTGTVTRLKDLDGDGVMDFYHDVITGLPGSQGPDYIHQNNGIAFAPDGSLYMTQGAHSNHGVIRSDKEGTILRADRDFQNVTVFARGFRNPFGIAILPNGDVFATDNDVDTVDPGDELNHVIEGAHYGHPLALADEEKGSDFQKPIYVDVSPLAGLTFTDSSSLPEQYRGCLYMVDSLKGRILRVELTPTGAGYKASVHPFAVIPGAVDLAVTSTGEFYVVCYENKEIFRIRYVGNG